MNISGAAPTSVSVAPRANQSAAGAASQAQGLEPEELKELAELKARDREVRAHEAAHQAAGGQYAGAISYVYERGPDGAQYAVGGEVSIDTSPIEGNPQATIEKMRTVRSAALAPAEPSPQDRAVAAQAMQLMLQAQAELAAEIGNPGGRNAAGSDDATPLRVNQAASETYRSVVALGGNDGGSPPAESFQARA